MDWPSDPTANTITTKIRSLLAERGMNQRQLAAKLGESSVWLSRRLTGRRPMQITDLVSIAGVLQVHVGALLGGPGNGCGATQN